MSSLTRRILKIVVFVGLFFLIGLIGTMIGVVGEKTSGGNNFRTPGWALIAAIVVPGYLCLSPWANRKIWKKDGHIETNKNKSDTTQETPESPVNTFCRGDESLEELLKMVSLQKERKAKLGVLQLITDIIKPSRTYTYNQFIQKLRELEPEIFNNTNELDQKLGTNTGWEVFVPENPNKKKEELPIQKIVESKPEESKPRISSTKPNFCGDCGASLASAKNFCTNCGKKL